MRVMCIKDSWNICPKAVAEGLKPKIVFGGVYTVVEERAGFWREQCWNEPHYILAEDETLWYAKSLFIPVSDEPAEIEDAEFEILEPATA